MVTESRRAEIINSMTISNVFPIYANLSQEERADPAIALRAVSLDGLTLRFTPTDALTKEIAERAVINSRHAIAFVPSELSVFEPLVIDLVQKTAA